MNRRGFGLSVVARDSATSTSASTQFITPPEPTFHAEWDKAVTLIDEPFVGLRSMREEEADRFFGRTQGDRGTRREIPPPSHRCDGRRQRHGKIVAGGGGLRPGLSRRRARRPFAQRTR